MSTYNKNMTCTNKINFNSNKANASNYYHHNLIVFTGDGKGKTTAALGCVLRTLSHSMNAVIYSFLKRDSLTKEFYLLEKMGVKIIKSQSPCTWNISKDGMIACYKEWNDLFDDIKSNILNNSNNINTIVLDEINHLFAINDFDTYDFENFLSDLTKIQLNNKSEIKNIILTGRNCPIKIINNSTICSEIKNLNHCYTKGEKPIKGIDF
jgi:cob(I)alamin adenosyltransferase